MGAYGAENYWYDQALRTIEKVGLDKMAKKAGIDLWKLPYEDCRPERIAYLKEHPMQVS